MTRKKGDYEVGYGKPPKTGQFVKGQSGTPRGRPKGKSKAVAAKKTVAKLTVADVDRLAGAATHIVQIDAEIVALTRNWDESIAKLQGILSKLGIYEASTLKGISHYECGQAVFCAIINALLRRRAMIVEELPQIDFGPPPCDVQTFEMDD